MIGKFIKRTALISAQCERTPTINYGSIMAMRIVGINDDYTMSLPLQILTPFAADFDLAA